MLDDFDIFLNVNKILDYGADVKFSYDNLESKYYFIGEEDNLTFYEIVNNRKKRHICSMTYNEIVSLCSKGYKEVYDCDVFDLLNTMRFEETVCVCILTNGDLDSKGHSIMDSDTAKTIKTMCPGIEKTLGDYITKYGNRVFNLGTYTFSNGNVMRIITFPTKHHFKENSDLTLIAKSLDELKVLKNKHNYETIFLPAIGIKNDGLNYGSNIKPLLDIMLDKYYYVFQKGGVI